MMRFARSLCGTSVHVTAVQTATARTAPPYRSASRVVAGSPGSREGSMSVGRPTPRVVQLALVFGPVARAVVLAPRAVEVLVLLGVVELHLQADLARRVLEVLLTGFEDAADDLVAAA